MGRASSPSGRRTPKCSSIIIAIWRASSESRPRPPSPNNGPSSAIVAGSLPARFSSETSKSLMDRTRAALGIEERASAYHGGTAGTKRWYDAAHGHTGQLHDGKGRGDPHPER